MEYFDAPVSTQPPIIVIGGDVVASSTASHSARDQEADMLLMAQGNITFVATWHLALRAVKVGTAWYAR